MSSGKCREQGSESESDSLWYIDGKGYDAGELVQDHPGGCEAIRLGRGIDCSALFHSYHLIKKPELPAPCRLGNLDRHGLAYTFDAGGFFDTVQQRAREYFQERQSGTHGSIGWQVVSALGLIATAVCLCLTLVTGSLWAALAHGLLRALTVVGPAHAATHFALFRRGRWNALAYRIASPLLISNFHFWSQAHVVGHHVHTNTPMDLQVHYPLKRVREAHGRLAFHRFQGIYMWVVYALGIPLWTLHDFLLSFLSFFTGTFVSQKLTVPQRIEAAITMTANVLVNLVLPFIYLDSWRAGAALLVSSIACSFVVILQNVVNHEVPDVAEFVHCDNLDWGAHQVLTSHDYAVGSRWALYCSGGLNLQIEHHLFPSVHYCHYPALAVIVRGACAEFGLPYHASSTFWEALKKHHSFLRLRARATGVT